MFNLRKQDTNGMAGARTTVHCWQPKRDCPTTGCTSIWSQTILSHELQVTYFCVGGGKLSSIWALETPRTLVSDPTHLAAASEGLSCIVSTCELALPLRIAPIIPTCVRCASPPPLRSQIWTAAAALEYIRPREQEDKVNMIVAVCDTVILSDLKILSHRNCLSC